MAFRSTYVCQQCGYSQVGWAGKCPECGTWNSLVETVVQSESKGKSKNKNSSSVNRVASSPIKLSEVSELSTQRISTKISELDRVLGGGIVAGQVILIAGEPGIGKSTLLTQLSGQLKVLYICGEESPGQIAVRIKRLGIKADGLELLEETDVDNVINTAEGKDKSISLPTTHNLSALIVDSIQTMTTTDLSGMAGSVGQVKECASRLVRFAKTNGIPVFIVGHVTKEGTVAGPNVLAHIVDTVLWFEGDTTTNLRILRSIKNRFGPTDEVGIFEMTEKGLMSVEDSQKIFLSEDTKLPDEKSKVSGTAIASIMQGTRPILVEIQALIVESKLAFPRRVAQGIDQKRLEVIIAVLIRRCGIPLYNYDTFVNVSGGIKISEPGSDLAVAMAIASSYFDKQIPTNTVSVGEIGLLGEIREVPMQDKRLKESKRLGYTNIISNKDYKYLTQAIKSIK